MIITEGALVNGEANAPPPWLGRSATGTVDEFGYPEAGIEPGLRCGARRLARVEGANGEVEERQHRPIAPGRSDRELGFPTSAGSPAGSPNIQPM